MCVNNESEYFGKFGFVTNVNDNDTVNVCFDGNSNSVNNIPLSDLIKISF